MLSTVRRMPKFSQYLAALYSDKILKNLISQSLLLKRTTTRTTQKVRSGTKVPTQLKLLKPRKRTRRRARRRNSHILSLSLTYTLSHALSHTYREREREIVTHSSKSCVKINSFCAIILLQKLCHSYNYLCAVIT